MPTTQRKPAAKTRRTAAKKTKPAGRRRKQTGAGTPEASGRQTASRSPRTEAPATNAAKVRTLAASTPAETFTVADIAAYLNVDRRSAGMLLAGLTQRGDLVRIAPATYQAASPAAGRPAATTARAPHGADGSHRRRTGRRRAPSTGPTAPAVASSAGRAREDTTSLRPVGQTAGGDVVLEDSAGGLWIATRLAHTAAGT